MTSSTPETASTGSGACAFVAPGDFSGHPDTVEGAAATALVVDPNSTRGIYEEALAELQTSERDEAKGIIASRIREIQRLRALLSKAETDLGKLLQKSPSEIAMMRF